MEENINVENLEEVLSNAFLEYAGYNLQRRAIPDVRDGLKWGARQLLHAQMLGKFTYNKPFKKAIKSVSQAMGFSYVHGDTSAYGTFIRMAKPFVMNVPLQEAKGNYGTLIDPDDHSASRYVEMRGSEAAAILLKDLEKETITEWEDTYDLEGQFPKVLPAKGFWGLVNGCISIGSGMSCSIPPFNLKEINEALIKLLWNPEISSDEILVYPDFPTGATILNKEDVANSLKNGTGFACKIRADVEWDNSERCFIVKELPYSTYTNTICKELAAIIDENPDWGIINFADYTGAAPDLRIYLNKKANPNKVLKLLYKNTSLENHFSINMTVLDKGIYPKVMGQKEMFQAHLDHEKNIYKRGFEFDLRKIKERLHIIEALLKAYDIIDEVIMTIKTSSSSQAANLALQKLLIIDEVQAKAILDLKLAKLSKLDISKLKNEMDELNIQSQKIEEILTNNSLLNKEIEKGLKEVAEKFGRPRRTQLINISKEEEEPIEIETLQLSFTNLNNLYLAKNSTLLSQKRGGVGNKIKLEKSEYIVNSIPIESTDTILFFTQSGAYCHLKCNELPVDEKISAFSFLPINDWDKIKAISSLNLKNKKDFILFITKNGSFKKSPLSEYNLGRKTLTKALVLDPDDEIIAIHFVDNEKIGILTERGNFLYTNTDSINPIGRVTKGIKGIKLSEDDYVISSKIISDTTKEICSITGAGQIKRTSLKEFSIQQKNTKGGKIQKIGEYDWAADFLPIDEQKEILISSTSACIKVSLNEVPLLGKNTQGVKGIKIAEKDNVINLN